MIEKIVNVVIKEDGFDNLNSKATTLDDNLENISHSNKSVSSSFAESSNAVLENGGAMGLLNDLTGGYAMMVKDAVEASALFIVKKRADTVATNATTVATVSANTATQQGIIGKIKDTAATVTSTVAKGASTVATNIATAAQWLWNAAVVANPLVALVVGIVAAGAALYKLTTFLLENAEANETASKATAKMTAQLKEQSMAAARGLRALKENADYNYELAKANGASTAELRKMKEASINAEIALNKKNVTIAQATFLQERNNLAVAKANDLSDEEIAKKEKLVQAAYKEFQEQNNLLDASYKGRAKLTRDFNVEITAENKVANDKANDEAKKQQDKRRDELKKERDAAIQKAKDDAKNEADRLKNIKDIINNYNKELQDTYDVTDQQKLDREKERAFAEIDLLKATEEEKNSIRSLATEKFLEKQNALDEKAIVDRLAYLEQFKQKEAEFNDAKTTEEIDKILEKKQADLDRQEENDIEKATKLNATEAEIQGIKDFYTQKDVENTKSAKDAKDALNSAELESKKVMLDALGQTLENASKLAGENTAAGKGLAIAGAVISTYRSAVDAYGGMVKAIPGPAGIVAGGIASASSVATGLATVKKIMAVQVPGSSGGGSAGSGGLSTPPPPPQFNIVGQSGTNQLAQSIGAKQGQPIQAYVVGNEVTSQQALDRNRINTATFN